jgi:nitrogen fixation NifU-like protein
VSLSTDSMYQQIILDHYKHPQHRGELATFDAEVHHVNPTCGDEVTLRVRVSDGQIAEIGWVGEGCSISQASTSVMTDLVVGTPIPDALGLGEKFLELMQSQGQSTLTEDEAERLEDAIAFEGVSKYPARVKCALLGWMAMKSAVAEATSDQSAASEPADAQDEERSSQS